MINSESSSMLRRRSAAVLLAAAPFLFAACGEQPDPYVMADFNGMTLKEADTKLEQVELHAKVEDRSGKNRQVWAPENWTVLDQKPDPGTEVGDDSPIAFGILKTEELGQNDEPSAPVIDAPVEFSEEMVRASGVTKQHKGGQSNVRFVAGTSDPDELRQLTDQCVDFYLNKTRAAYCYGYETQADFGQKDPSWTAESDRDIWGGARPCWSSYGGQPLNGPDSRQITTVGPKSC
ncbi:PASTA domain-containing protein [Dietzia kunjamensis]|uniref:PASTA domain-containing protein n=1 Tax=Dietzia kunjamensis TaxID=322509 RepID=UPI0032AE9CBA